MYLTRVMRAAASEVRDIAYAKTPTHAHLRDRLVAIAVTTMGIDLICAVLALVFEHGAKLTQITSLGSALFWTSTQLLTVSSSILNPISTGGRILDVIMEAYAITVVASMARLDRRLHGQTWTRARARRRGKRQAPLNPRTALTCVRHLFRPICPEQTARLAVLGFPGGSAFRQPARERRRASSVGAASAEQIPSSSL